MNCGDGMFDAYRQWLKIDSETKELKEWIIQWKKNELKMIVYRQMAVIESARDFARN